MTTYSFNKVCDSGRLKQEIQLSSITIVLEYTTVFGSQTDCVFRTSISLDEETILSTLITNHVATPLPSAIQTIEVSKMPSLPPFADPLFRTKHNKTASSAIVANGSSGTIDYVLQEELYVSGGTLLVKNVQLGDWVSAEIRDINGVIPEAYRAATCEAWPTASQYIIGQYLEVYDSNSLWFKQGVDTRPLVAKISAGLSLRVTYNAANIQGASDRQIFVNYFLNKKV